VGSDPGILSCKESNAITSADNAVGQKLIRGATKPPNCKNILAWKRLISTTQSNCVNEPRIAITVILVPFL